MQRRRFLAGAVTLPLFGGCQSVTGGSETATSTRDQHTDSTAERDSRPPASQDVDLSFEPGADEPFDQFTVGDGVERDDRKPHQVVVWNDGSEREIDVFVGTDDGEPTLDRRLTFPADGYLSLELTERVGYQVAAGVSDGPEYAFDLSDSIVDCNSSRSAVRVGPDGKVAYFTISTAMGCVTSH